MRLSRSLRRALWSQKSTNTKIASTPMPVMRNSAKKEAMVVLTAGVSTYAIGMEKKITSMPPIVTMTLRVCRNVYVKTNMMEPMPHKRSNISVRVTS